MSKHRSPSSSLTVRTGLVVTGIITLGIGLTFIARTDTVAAFSDSMWGSSFFETAEASFDIESSVDGTNYESHPVDNPGGPLVFSPALSLRPGHTVYAGFYLRTATSSKPVQVEMNAATAAIAPLNDFVTYGARLAAPSQADCADAFGSPGDPDLVPEGTALTAIPSPLPAWPLDGTGDNPVKLCFAFHLNPEAATAAPAANGTSVSPTWTFTAEPQS